ncbi:hypothetical protein BDY24DRAFT_384160 [Mrakia frigida]|uniref:uncharacterized protein n=1 Tax=Mrakia frigida TaxID=29902 RepID=UPI003FCC1236
MLTLFPALPPQELCVLPVFKLGVTPTMLALDPTLDKLVASLVIGAGLERTMLSMRLKRKRGRRSSQRNKPWTNNLNRPPLCLDPRTLPPPSDQSPKTEPLHLPSSAPNSVPWRREEEQEDSRPLPLFSPCPSRPKGRESPGRNFRLRRRQLCSKEGLREGWRRVLSCKGWRGPREERA